MKTRSFFSFVALLLMLYIKASESARILALFPLPCGSHMNIIKVLVKPLLEKGHELDVVSHFPLRLGHKQYRDLDISGSFPSLKGNLTIDKSIVGDLRSIGISIDQLGVVVIDKILSTKVMNELKNSSKSYDLILRHIFLSDPLEAFSHIFNTLSIGIITSVNLPWLSDIFGLPDNPAYIPNYYSTYGENMNYFQRFFNTVIYIFTKFKFAMSRGLENAMLKKHFGHGVPPVESLAMRTNVVLCNSHYSMNQVKPILPNFIEIGGIHIWGRSNNTLSKNLKKALDSATQGLIYVSFGSLIRSEGFGYKQLETMFQSLGKLPYKIFWKGSKNNFPNTLKIPTNFHFESWMPQLEILCHPNTKLFVSHGGMFGIQEAVSCGVPILGIPFGVDQGSNLQFLVEKNVAKYVTYEDVTHGDFEKAAKMLLEPKYKANAETLSKLFLDRPMSPIDTALYWIEYVLKHNGGPYMKSAATKLSWYQYYLVDVIGLMLVSLVVVTVIIYLIALRLYRIAANGNKLGYRYDMLKTKIKCD